VESRSQDQCCGYISSEARKIHDFRGYARISGKIFPPDLLLISLTNVKLDHGGIHVEVKIRSIGNALGIIIPKHLTSLISLHADDAVELNVEDDRLIITRKIESLKENLLLGIQASQAENLEFAESFDELESERW